MVSDIELQRNMYKKIRVCDKNLIPFQKTWSLVKIWCDRKYKIADLHVYMFPDFLLLIITRQTKSFSELVLNDRDMSYSKSTELKNTLFMYICKYRYNPYSKLLSLHCRYIIAPGPYKDWRGYNMSLAGQTGGQNWMIFLKRTHGHPAGGKTG